MTDDERAVVFEMNDWLRNKLRWNEPLFQKLRRCAMCGAGPCADAARCREALNAWTKQKWSAALKTEWQRRNPGLDSWHAPNFDGN